MMEAREGSEGQSHKEEEREGGSGTGKGNQRPLAQKGGHYLDVCVGVRVFSYATADGVVCVLSQGRFQEPVRPDRNCTSVAGAE